MATERIQKVIARAGVASRREAEKMVLEGRVQVNNEVIYRPGHRVDPLRDLIKVDDTPLPPPETFTYLLMYKPRGVITTRNDPEGRETVIDLLPELRVRVEPVGRLDLNTSGALLLTNDGDLAHQLTHPSSTVPKRYLAKVWRTPSGKTLNRLRRGISLEDGRTPPCKVRVAEQTETDNAWLEITVTEGRNRLIRRMMEKVNHPVSKLRRESFATLSIRGMEPGQIRVLTGQEIERLQDIADGRAPQEAGHRQKYKKGYARPKPKRKGTPLSRKKASTRRRHGRSQKNRG